MNWNRIITAAVMGAVCLLAPLQTRAAESYTAVDLGDGTVAVKCNDPSVIHANIPAQLDGKTVTGLAANCFDGCSSLESVTLPEGILSIGEYAFQGCVMLDTVEIPASVDMIDNFVFEGCYSLKSISVAEENTHYIAPQGVLYTADQTMLLRYPAAKEDTAYVVSDSCYTISPWAFTDCVNLKKVEMRNVTAIGADCFMGCTSLKTATLSRGITELNGAAFAKCSNLQEITLPPNLASIGDRCFFGCAALGKLTLPDNLKSIGEMAFYGCTGLTFLYVPESVTSIGKHGIGYSVSEDAKTVLIPGFRMETTVGSYAAKYASENGIDCHLMLSRSKVVLFLVLAVLAALAIIALAVNIRNRREKARAEQERLAEEEKQKRLAERRKARQQKKKE